MSLTHKLKLFIELIMTTEIKSSNPDNPTLIQKYGADIIWALGGLLSGYLATTHDIDPHVFMDTIAGIILGSTITHTLITRLKPDTENNDLRNNIVRSGYAAILAGTIYSIPRLYENLINRE